jgi:hypothetical protein
MKAFSSNRCSILISRAAFVALFLGVVCGCMSVAPAVSSATPSLALAAGLPWLGTGTWNEIAMTETTSTGARYFVKLHINGPISPQQRRDYENAIGLGKFTDVKPGITNIKASPALAKLADHYVASSGASPWTIRVFHDYNKDLPPSAQKDYFEVEIVKEIADQTTFNDVAGYLDDHNAASHPVGVTALKALFDKNEAALLVLELNP